MTLSDHRCDLFWLPHLRRVEHIPRTIRGASIKAPFVTEPNHLLDEDLLLLVVEAGE